MTENNEKDDISAEYRKIYNKTGEKFKILRKKAQKTLWGNEWLLSDRQVLNVALVMFGPLDPDVIKYVKALDKEKETRGYGAS